MKCLNPFYQTKLQLSFPCGKCPPCKAQRTSGWTFRMNQEAKISQSAQFITLTYNPETVPKTQNGLMTLQKQDVQNFIKRLRKLHFKTDPPIKYYAAGEYGEQTERPHYHIIIFNTNIRNIEKAWTLNNQEIGLVYDGNLSDASAAYTAKYIDKPFRIPMHELDDRNPEFSLMSKKLGQNYLTPEMVRWHQNDPNERYYIPLKDGKKIAMPRYYKEKIFTKEQREQIGEHMQRKLSHEMLKKSAETIENEWNSEIASQLYILKNHNNDKRNKKL